MAATLSWQVPGVVSDNTFSVVLVSDQALQNVSLDDFTFRRDDGMFFEASTYATLTQVAGTNNWRLDVTLTGTHDNNFQARLRPNRVTDEDGTMNALLNSASFAVETGYVGLTVAITGGENIEQGQQVTLTAVVTDADGNTPAGTLQYAWSASRGSFVGAVNQATAVYVANFMGAVDVTCEVTRPANATPTSAGPSLTALHDLGITGILVNMFMTALGDPAPNTNSVIFNASTGTIDAGSDQRLSSDINIFQLRWDNTVNNFVLNNNEGGNIGAFFTNNNNQSVYIIFADGTYEELTPANFAAGTSRGQGWARWLVTDTNIRLLLNGLSTTDDLVVGVGDAGSIGWDLVMGSDTERLTARVPQPLGIESIDEQFITVGTEDYDLVINITGRPDTAIAKGHMEGFGQDWDSVNGQLHIKSEEVTRQINGVNWDIEVVKDMQTLMGQIAYNVVQAAPIFAALGTIHLYKGVPINFDIIIQNIPPLLIPNAALLGLKSELLDYGINVKGEISATDNLAFSSGNVSIIVPSETGGADTTYNYAYEIEDGSPGQIMSPEFRPKGRYGELEFPDVTHALSYDWRLGDSADAVWNTFDSTRQIINPGDVEIMLGHLNVTVKFPNVPGASSYEYMLESDTHEVPWTRFTGTLANGFITTIIPNLQEGVEYVLWLRVGAPWVGTAISITIMGGRLAYTLQINLGDRDNQWLYIFSTGHAHATLATRMKRLLLPVSMSHIENGGLAVSPDGDVFVINTIPSGEKAVYVFLASTIDSAVDGARLTQDRKHLFASAMATASNTSTFYGMAVYDNKLYIYASTGIQSGWRGLQIWNIPTTDGTVLTRTTTGDNIFISPTGFGLSVTEESVWYKHLAAFSYPAHYDRTDLSSRGFDSTLRNSDNTLNDELRDGLKVIGSNFYNIASNNDRLEIFRINPDVSETVRVLDFYLNLPVGLSTPRFLDILA